MHSCRWERVVIAVSLDKEKSVLFGRPTMGACTLQICCSDPVARPAKAATLADLTLCVRHDAWANSALLPPSVPLRSLAAVLWRAALPV